MFENTEQRTVSGLKKRLRENGENYVKRITNSAEIKVTLPLCLTRHTHDDIYVGEDTLQSQTLLL